MGGRAGILVAVLLLTALTSRTAAADGRATEPLDNVDEGAPIGQAAPPTAAGRTEIPGSPIRAGLEAFAQYGYRGTKTAEGGTHWTHAFDVPRVHGAVEGRWRRSRGRVVVEATRLADDTSATSSTGDGLVFRVREAWGSFQVAPGLEVSAGVIPTLTIPELDGTWMLRPVAASSLQTQNLLAPADLGAKMRYDLPGGYGWIASAAFNGDGYNSRKLNTGSDVESAIELHPFAKDRTFLPLALFASLNLGTRNVESVRSNRFTTGLLWQGERLRLGAVATWAYGVANVHDQTAILATWFARVEPVPRVLLGARIDHVIRNLEAPTADKLTSFWATAGYRIAVPIETFLALSRALATTRAEREMKESDLWEARVVGRVVF